MQLFDCGKGQSIMSLSNWAKQWGVAKDTARNFLVLLEKDGMILHESLGKTTRITVCNYDSYQDELHDSRTLSDFSSYDGRTIAGTNKKNKKNKNEKNNKEIDDCCSSKFMPIVLDWLKYKAERKETYRSKSSIKVFCKKLEELSNGDINKARLIIEQSIANNWAGIFELKSNQNTAVTHDKKLGPGERIENGCRTYGSGAASIPMDAPARPSEQYTWDAGSLRWIIL